MAPLLAALLSKIGGTLIDKVGSAVTSKIESSTQKALVEAEIAKIVVEHQAELEKQFVEILAQQEKEISVRWEADAKSDSFMAKNARPVGFLTLLFSMLALAIMDGNVKEFVIQASWIVLIKDLLLTMTVAYFGARGIEKVTATIGEKFGRNKV